MKGLGYMMEYFEKCNGMSASAVFYKKAKFNMLESHQVTFETGGSQFFMYCLFALKDDDNFKFVFGETHLKAKPANMASRVK